MTGSSFSFVYTLSSLTRSTLSILPHSGRIAWKELSRPCFCRTARRITLDDIDFGAHIVMIGQSASLPGRLTPSRADFSFPGAVSCQACRFSCLSGCQRLIHDGACNCRIFLEVGAHLLVGDAVDQGAHLGVAQLGLGLSFKLCFF